MYKPPKPTKVRKIKTDKWAVFNIETKFRLTDYTIRAIANMAMQSILYEQPQLRGKIKIKQKNFE
jgi:hypothetical protein